MNTNTTDSESAGKPESEVTKIKRKRTPAKKANPSKKQATTPAGKPKAARTNKKAEAIAMLKRSKGATLAEIMATTEWQAHTMRGFVSILASKDGETNRIPALNVAFVPRSTPAPRGEGHSADREVPALWEFRCLGHGGQRLSQ